MSGIERLTSEVIDQIAAGEVVERPSHMVKELIENSIDAGATEISVAFDFGGRSLLIEDNGHGIQKDDLELALSRHATSKISKGEDLWQLNSFGFRGEALASLAAVSQLTLSSRHESSSQAYQLHSDYGKFEKVKPVGGDFGTRIVVANLFENVPARLKFLKSEAAEGTQIKMVLKAMAISHPKVKFRVTNKDKLLFLWPEAESSLERAEQVLEIQPLYYGEGECQSVRARVCVSAPNMTQRTSRQMWFFVQDRWVQDRSLQAAVMDAYRSLLMHGEYPSVAVWLEVDPEEVDVNVHPSKSKVKFRNQSDAFRAVNRAIKSVLNEAPWLIGIKPKEDLRSLIETETAAEVQSNLEFSQPAFQRVQFSQPQIEPSTSEVSEAPTESREEIGFWSKLQIIGQAGLTYLVCQNEKALILIDQHAAHERVAYERIMKSWEGGGLEVQNLLVPLSIQLDEDQVEAIARIAPDLSDLGLSVEVTGPSSLVVTGLPSIAKEKAIVKAMHFLGKELMEKGGSFALENTLSHIAATLACHSVVRAGQALSNEEMQGLLEQMDEFSHSSFCPHGRPVYVEYGFNEIEKDFGRIV